jgi:multidrug resistance efflux pump
MGNRPVVGFGFVDLEAGLANLVPLATGRVVKVSVEDGALVKKGQVLLELDAAPARARQQEAEAALRAAQAGLARAQRQVALHPIRLEQQQAALEAAGKRLTASWHGLAAKRRLFAIHQAAEEDVSAAAALVAELEAQDRGESARLQELRLSPPTDDVERARAEVDLAEARMVQARQAVADCVLCAPEDGRVLRIQAALGELVGPTSRPVVQFGGAGPLVVRCEIDQEFAAEVREGQSAWLEDDVKTRTGWPGQVKRVAGWHAPRRNLGEDPAAARDVRTVECLIALTSPLPNLKFGQRLRVTIRTEE